MADRFAAPGEQRAPAEKRRDCEAFLRRLWELEKRLVANGFPAMPFWWRREVERFYRSGKRRWVIRKGRRVFASTCVAPRLAVAEMLWGKHKHLKGMPPLMYVFISVKRDEAEKRLRGVKAILDLLGEKYGEKGETIELESRPAIFSVVTANFKTSVGDTLAFCWCDEVSRWNDDGASPAEEVVGTVSPALATLPDARLFLVSSPLTTDDYHARQYDLGETDGQCVSFGNTWTINPTMSEEDCHREEPDERRFLREWAAIPQSAESAALPPDAISRAQRYLPAGLRMMTPVVTIDFSGGRGDACVWSRICWAHQDELPEFVSEKKYMPGVGHYFEPILDELGQPTPNPEYEPRRPLLVVGPLDHQTGKFWDSIPSSSLVARIARDAKRWGAQCVIGDQAHNYGLESLFAQHDLRFISVAWSNPNKQAAVVRLNRLLRDKEILLPMPSDGPAAARLDAEARAYNERVLPSGALQYSAPGSGHDDHVSACLITPLIADSLNLLPHSPTAPRSRRDMNSIREFLSDGS